MALRTRGALREGGESDTPALQGKLGQPVPLVSRIPATLTHLTLQALHHGVPSDLLVSCAARQLPLTRGGAPGIELSNAPLAGGDERVRVSGRWRRVLEDEGRV